MSIGKRLKEARKQANYGKGITQNELSTLSGVSQQMISRLENEVALKTGDIVPLANALGVLAEWLDSGSGPMLPGSTQETRTVNESTARPYLTSDQIIIDLDTIQDAMRFIYKHYESKFNSQTPDEKGRTFFKLCNLFNDKAAKDMQPATIIRLIE